MRAALLSEPDQFPKTVTEKLMAYALGRRLEYYDHPAVRKIVHAGGDPYQDVAGGESTRGQVARSDRRIVLGGLGGSRKRGGAAGDDSLHQIGRNGKSGRTLRGIEHAQASAGARADVKQAAALFHRRDDRIHCPRNGRNLTSHRIRHFRVFAIDHFEHPLGGKRIDGGRIRVRLFGK